MQELPRYVLKSTVLHLKHVFQNLLEKRIDNLDKGLNRMNDLRSEMNSRFDTIQWMLGRPADSRAHAVVRFLPRVREAVQLTIGLMNTYNKKIKQASMLAMVVASSWL